MAGFSPMVRREFYSADLTNTTVGLFGQQIGANGWSVATSAGYNFALANNWFIEPSAGFIWSRTEVDPFNISGGPDANGIVSTFTSNPIESEIGRLSLRAGTTISSGYMIWQPFASASVFHEFAGNVTSTAASLPNGAFAAVGLCPACVVTPISLTGHQQHDARRHLWPVLAGPGRADCKHRLARLRSRRLPQWQQYRGLDRQWRYPLPVHT
jgi:hypothetical protein